MTMEQSKLDALRRDAEEEFEDNLVELRHHPGSLTFEFAHDNEDGDFLDNDFVDHAIIFINRTLEKHGLTEWVLEEDPTVENRAEGNMLFIDEVSLFYVSNAQG